MTVEQLIGGMRGIKSMLWETSLLDSNEGIRMRGFTLPELRKVLPTAHASPGGGEPIPEGVLWLLMTGEVPTPGQAAQLTAELKGRAAMSPHVECE